MAKEILGNTTVRPLNIESIKKKMRDIASIQARRAEMKESLSKISDIYALNYEEAKYLLELLGEKV